MKCIPKILSSVLLIFIFSCINPLSVSAQRVVSFQVFYDELSPYGTWVQNPQYGYVWYPNEGPGFVPYSSQGYWTLTDYGWTWVSYYPWGWAPFHYGRWYDDPSYGPMWVPDNEWGPGWVSWRRSNDYYGWAPISPGVSLDMAYSNGYDVPSNRWTFVRNRDFGRRNSHNYYVNASRKGEIYKGTSAFNNERFDKEHNSRFNQGPDRKEVEKHWGRSITPRTVQEINTPGQKIDKSHFQIYRPQVQKESPTGSRFAPAKVSDIKDVKPPAQRVSQPSHFKNNKTTNTSKNNTQAPKPTLNKSTEKPHSFKSTDKTQRPAISSQQKTQAPQKPTNRIQAKPNTTAKGHFQKPVQPTKQSSTQGSRMKPQQQAPKVQQSSPPAKMHSPAPQPQMKTQQAAPRTQQPPSQPRIQNPPPQAPRMQQQQNIPHPPPPSRQTPTNQGHKIERK